MPEKDVIDNFRVPFPRILHKNGAVRSSDTYISICQGPPLGAYLHYQWSQSSIFMCPPCLKLFNSQWISSVVDQNTCFHPYVRCHNIFKILKVKYCNFGVYTGYSLVNEGMLYCVFWHYLLSLFVSRS